MSIKEKYQVRSIDSYLTYDWLKNKHYAKRIPSISYSFGLYDLQNILCGVATYGMPANYVEMKEWDPYALLELNRLVVNDGLEKNALSFFVAKTLNMIPNEKIIISYSDFEMGHYGYIYQATNWHYTGIGSKGEKIFCMKDGTERHQRHRNKINIDQVKEIKKTIGKARYYYFIGDKKFKKLMLQKLRYEILPYPKGDNQRYDSSYNPSIQTELF